MLLFRDTDGACGFCRWEEGSQWGSALRSQLKSYILGHTVVSPQLGWSLPAHAEAVATRMDRDFTTSCALSSFSRFAPSRKLLDRRVRCFIDDEADHSDRVTGSLVSSRSTHFEDGSESC